MAERIVLIVNPTSTRVRPALRAEVERALAPVGLAYVVATERGGHAAELAARAVAEQATTIVVLGGDGTVNEVAGAVAGSNIGLAALPAGSTNVFARALGWPHPAGRALHAVARALESPTWRTVRLGRVEAGSIDRVFCVNAGAGLDAETVHLIEARPWLKTRLRHGGFAGATAVAAFRASRRPPDLTVRVDDGPAEHLTSVVVACGAPYAYLGSRPLDLVPGADFGDRLRWIGMRSAHLTSVGRTVAGALRGGRHIRLDSVSSGWACERVDATSDGPIAVQADGEPLGWHTHIRFGPGPPLRALVATASDPR